MVPVAFAISAKTPMGASLATKLVILDRISDSRERGSIRTSLFLTPVRASPIMMLNTTTAGTMPLDSEKKGLEGI